MNKEEYIKKEQELIDKQYEIIEKISELRNKKRLSQTDLATIIDMKQPALARIENNVNSPKLSTILKILDVLGYTLEIKKKS